MENCLPSNNSQTAVEFDLQTEFDSQREFDCIVGMQTKKEKILIQPFIEQNYKKHRRKVT